MGALIGNKNAVGNKGGGRKSFYQEMADAKRLHEIFFTPRSLEELSKRIEEGKFSPEDKFIQRLMQGNTRLLENAVNKIWSDKLDINDNAKERLVDFLTKDDDTDSKKEAA